MSAAVAPNHINPAPGHDPGVAGQLPADAYYHLVRTLRLTLPPPLGDSPEDTLRRDHAAIARIAALAPANAAEADVAAQFIAASEQWKDCLRLGQFPETTREWAGKCRAQAMGMMRQANSALRLLLRMQEARRKLEADNAACDRLAWTEHCVIGLMAQALSGSAQPRTPGVAILQGAPPSAEATPEVIADPPPPEPQPTPVNPGAGVPIARAGSHRTCSMGARQWEPGRGGVDPMDEPPAGAISAAEEYALLYPERAALIRELGRVPNDAPFGPPDEDVVQALIASRIQAAARESAPCAA